MNAFAFTAALLVATTATSARASGFDSALGELEAVDGFVNISAERRVEDFGALSIIARAETSRDVGVVISADDPGDPKQYELISELKAILSRRFVNVRSTVDPPVSIDQLTDQAIYVGISLDEDGELLEVDVPVYGTRTTSVKCDGFQRSIECSESGSSRDVIGSREESGMGYFSDLTIDWKLRTKPAGASSAKWQIDPLFRDVFSLSYTDNDCRNVVGGLKTMMERVYSSSAPIRPDEAMLETSPRKVGCQ